MPYIPAKDRTMAKSCPVNVGELTFVVQQALKDYVDRNGESYQRYAECLMALRGAELDLWDRKLRDYEHAKCAQNGDVW